MVENVDKVLKRGEHLDLLVDKAEDLQHEVRMRCRLGKKGVTVVLLWVIYNAFVMLYCMLTFLFALFTD